MLSLAAELALTDVAPQSLALADVGTTVVSTSIKELSNDGVYNALSMLQDSRSSWRMTVVIIILYVAGFTLKLACTAGDPSAPRAESPRPFRRANRSAPLVSSHRRTLLIAYG